MYDELMERLSKTAAPVPPKLAQAVGYEGSSRFVALHWGGGDEVYFDGGVVNATGNWHPYLLYTKHNAVWPHLVGFHFGSSDEEAKHWLLIDQQEQAAFAGSPNAVHAVLMAQHPKAFTQDPTRELSGRDLQEAFADFMSSIQAKERAWNTMSAEEQMAEVRAKIAEEAERSRTLCDWLDRQDTSRAKQLLAEFHAQLERSIEQGTPPPRPPVL